MNKEETIRQMQEKMCAWCKRTDPETYAQCTSKQKVIVGGLDT